MSYRKKVTLHDLQSGIVLLNFACVEMCRNCTCEAGGYIQCWLQFITHFNGKSAFLNDTGSYSDHLTLHTDAAFTGGFAAIGLQLNG